MAYSITLAGQNITNNVQQLSIAVDDTLGQGPGAGNSAGTQGRASTIKFNCTLGPMPLAKGAGNVLPGGGPYLVRYGEILIQDQFGNPVFGGFATKFTDTSDKTVAFTTVEGIDYSTSLQSIIVNESFSAQNDVYIITYILAKYAPWVKLDFVTGLAPAYTFPIKNFRNVSVEQIIQTVAGVTGYQVWIDFNKYMHYTPPNLTSSAPFKLSDQPDFLSSFPHNVEEFLIDDNSAINRVYFYGGRKQSADFQQDVSPLANSNNTIFVFAYYPRPDSTGKVRVSVNGTFLTVGDQNGTGAANTLVSAGGTATALINYDARTMTFNTAPATGATVLLYYRYELPLVLALTDPKSYAFFGRYLDGAISDDTIFDTQTAVQRCRVLLTQQSLGLTTLKLICWRPGLQAGQLLNVKNVTRGINTTYLIQEVATTVIGGGTFQYEVTCGAWNWNVVDVLMKLAMNPMDTSTTENVIAVTINTATFNIGQTFLWTKSIRTMGGYFARTTAVGDGHDAYPGFFSITT